MDLSKIEKQWSDYCTEFESSEEMDIETHILMASKVGVLLREIREQQREIERLKNLLTDFYPEE